MYSTAASKVKMNPRADRPYNLSVVEIIIHQTAGFNGLEYSILLSIIMEVLHNLFEAIVHLFKYPTTGRRAEGKFDNTLSLIVHQ